MKTEERPRGGQLIEAYTSEGQLSKLTNGLPPHPKLNFAVDRLAANQSHTRASTTLESGGFRFISPTNMADSSS